MKKAGILFSFFPLIVYGILAGKSASSVIIALGAATLMTILVGFSDLRKGMILTWANLVLFGVTFIAAGILNITGIIPVMGVLIYMSLAAVTFGSILFGIPFTLQYAREMVDRTLWENPGFIRVNILMTGVWGLVFAVNAILNCVALLNPERFGWIAVPITYLVLVAGIIFTLYVPGICTEKKPPCTYAGWQLNGYIIFYFPQFKYSVKTIPGGGKKIGERNSKKIMIHPWSNGIKR